MMVRTDQGATDSPVDVGEPRGPLPPTLGLREHVAQGPGRHAGPHHHVDIEHARRRVRGAEPRGVRRELALPWRPGGAPLHASLLALKDPGKGAAGRAERAKWRKGEPGGFRV